MASTKQEPDTRNTLQRAIEEEKAKIPSKFEFNKVLFSWEANDRPTYTYTGRQKTTFTALVVLFGLYFIWIGQPLLTLVAGAVFFIFYVLVSMPPERVKHSFEIAGIRTNGTLYDWESCKRFWMTEKDGVIMLYIDTRLKFPTRFVFIIETFEEALEVAKILISKMEYRIAAEKQKGMDKMLEGTYIDPIIFFGEAVQEEKKV